MIDGWVEGAEISITMLLCRNASDPKRNRHEWHIVVHEDSKLNKPIITSTQKNYDDRIPDTPVKTFGHSRDEQAVQLTFVSLIEPTIKLSSCDSLCLPSVAQ